ncbi:alpha-ketoglutaric semialdehyde dehydrogenase/NADP-dependent aldehyde dehydrogenase [Filimonas lacunae]|uniref:Alpha-ketoglutaric semialdehyde dehydrogenase/NADP-dependent aldehyde dehydrogenase n=1 Tax=Filimonas lacunae TaxID=477680 RepID=A0A173MGQ2_9BACT|nr:aldehyde dehydrogenase (NADP(+)) [Filimonas lacunae]BAV06783.1 ketoglutarate semialdehyde dehydrogenase [Filimonas lacunae]SIT34367.1 alpha-ketoglutaric semialdehyde dehydrogenase/NADP-dependent aldehyde dehydrogenase [Filimonas lacunae]
MREEKHIIGYGESGNSKEVFYSINPSGKENSAVYFHQATAEEVNQAVQQASSSFALYRKIPAARKAAFLNAIAAELENCGDALITTCMQETALPRARLEGERARTTGQLRMFATLVAEGSWVDARIETALPDRKPLPKPDMRYMNIPLGPVAVFGASNFPLAFSVAGGDTASALAAGCTVVVKAHPAHPATSALAGKAIQRAAQSTGMPDGVFSLLFDSGTQTGAQLVTHPLIKAVAFTGSYRGGKALYDMAVRRPEPIPVFAEMGSTNPVFVLPEAAQQKGATIAEAYSASVAMGVGQFCTSPGMLFYPQQAADFNGQLSNVFSNITGGVMLAAYMYHAYQAGVEERLALPAVATLASGKAPDTTDTHVVTPVLMTTHSDELITQPLLREEIFGPASIAVPVTTREAMLALAHSLPGQLTATVHGTAEELPAWQELLDILEQKAGRVVINGFPTGVEPVSAMVHGGPFPATTNSSSTSVGTAAIYRFVRPVCYQNMPDALLPAELQESNPMGIYRMVNGGRAFTQL